MIKILVAVFLLFCIELYAEPKISFSTQSLLVLQGQNTLGTIHPNTAFFSQNQNFSQSAYVPIIKTNKHSHKTLDSIKIELASKGFHSVIDNDYVLYIDNLKTKRKTKSRHRSKKIKEQDILKEVFSEQYMQQFSLLSVDTEFVQTKKFKKIESLTFNFQRVFQKRIVRSQNNYLQIQTSEDGNIQNIELAIEDLKTTEDFIDCSELFEAKVSALDSIIKTDFSKLTQTGDENNFIDIDSIFISGATEAYCEMGTFLYPCLSYAAELTLPSKKKFWDIIDAPHSLKTFQNFNGKQVLVQGNR